MRERAVPVDLQHGKVLAIPSLEIRVAVDGDDLELELDARLSLPDDLESARAEAAACRGVENDASYG